MVTVSRHKKIFNVRGLLINKDIINITLAETTLNKNRDMKELAIKALALPVSCRTAV